MVVWWLAASMALAAPWPFDEDASTRSASATYPGTFDAPPVQHWVVALPGGKLNVGSHTEGARPMVHGPHVYVGSAGGRALYVMSRSSGVQVRALPAASSVESEPVFVGERVLFGDTAGTTWCYALSGELVWSHRSAAPILSSPTVHGSRVFVTNVDDLGYALDLETGELQWRYAHKADISRDAELALYAAPAAAWVEGLVLMGFSDGALVALNAETGDVEWSRRVGEGRYPDLAAAPVTSATDVFASGYFQPLVAIDQASRNVRWRAEVGAAATPILSEMQGLGVLVHPGIDGRLRSYVTLTGAERWTWNSQTDGALTTPVDTPAGLLVGSSEGGLYLLDPITGVERWRYHGELQLAGVSAAPTVDGRQLLFVTNAGNLHSMLAP